jgi:hypothetical protein
MPPKRLHPDLHDAFGFAAIQQVLLWLVTCVWVIGPGIFEVLMIITCGAYWTGGGWVLARRRLAPSRFDLVFLKWGTFVIYAGSFLAAIPFHRGP